MIVVAAILVLAAVAAAPAAGEDPLDTHPAPGVSRQRIGGALQWRVAVPGTILDWQALDGVPWLLVDVEELGRPVLYRADLERRELRAFDPLGEEVDRLHAADVDGDGEAELVAGRPGSIFAVDAVGSSATLRELARSPGIDLAAALPTLDERPDRLELPTVGALLRFEWRDGAWRRSSRPLPVRAARSGFGLERASPPTQRIGDRWLAIGPESVGGRRLRSVLVDAAGIERVVWNRLPGAELPQHRRFLDVDGDLRLAVTTNSADEVGALERQTLHLFGLGEDRTRSGSPPLLSAPLANRRWQAAEPFSLDADGDGDDDLVVLQVDGLGGRQLRAELFEQDEQGRFRAPGRRASIEVAPLGWWLGDLDGDGRPELVVVDVDGTLSLFEADADRRSRRWVDRRPSASVPGDPLPRSGGSLEIGSGGVVVRDERPHAAGRPRAVDVDGDGRLEVVLADNPRWGFGRLRIVDFGAPP